MRRYYIYNETIKQFLARDGKNWVPTTEHAAGFLTRKAAQLIVDEFHFQLTKLSILSATRASHLLEAPQAKWEDHGSVCLFNPLNEAARRWVKQTAPEDAQFWGECLVVEPRYTKGVQEAFIEAGGIIVNRRS